MTYVLLLLGFVALVGGAEILVRGASAIAVRTGLSPVVVGLTVVAFGTSTPEMAVSVGAARNDQAGLAIGNVVGSNIANVLLVLGVSAAIGGSLIVAQKIVRIDVPLMIAASVVVLLMSLDGEIGRVEGLVLFGAILAYTGWTVRAARGEDSDVTAEYEEAFGGGRERSVLVDVASIVGGTALLVLGARWLVDSASKIAESFGVSELVIGLTVVAIGTSAPELATSVVAAIRGERDIAVGNVVGSNLFNLLAVLGMTAIVAPGGLPVSDDALRLDLPIMLAVAIACLPVFFNGYLLKRWEGTLFAVYYVAYLAFLVLDETGSGLRDPFAVVMGVFVLPLTAITLIVVGARAVKANRAAATTRS
jgi:cation:H+ antiporter